MTTLGSTRQPSMKMLKTVNHPKRRVVIHQKSDTQPTPLKANIETQTALTQEMNVDSKSHKSATSRNKPQITSMSSHNKSNVASPKSFRHVTAASLGLPRSLMFKLASDQTMMCTVHLNKVLASLGGEELTNQTFTTKVTQMCERAFRSKERLGYVFKDSGLLITNLLDFCAPKNRSAFSDRLFISAVPSIEIKISLDKTTSPLQGSEEAKINADLWGLSQSFRGCMKTNKHILPFEHIQNVTENTQNGELITGSAYLKFQQKFQRRRLRIIMNQ